MHHSAVPPVQAELLARRPQVALVIEVAADLLRLLVGHEERKDPDVKLPPVDEQRVLDVPLEDDVLEATSLPVHAEKVLLDVGVDLLQVVEDADAEAAVRGLAWLEYPEVLVPLGLVCVRLEEGSVLGVAFEVVLQLYQVRLGHVVVD